MQKHSKTKMQTWIVRAAVLALVAPMVGCDAGDEPENLAADDDGEESSDGEEDVEFRDLCGRPANPSADVSTTLAGAATSVTREGSGTGEGCDLFTVRVATPSGHRAREIVIEGNYGGSLGAVAYAWRRTCTTPPPGFPVACTGWQNVALDEFTAGGGCDWAEGVGDWVCFGSVDGYADLPANSYSDILVGARVEYDDSDVAQPISITVSE